MERFCVTALQGARYCAQSVSVKLLVVTSCMVTHILLAGYAEIQINQMIIHRAAHLEENRGARLAPDVGEMDPALWLHLLLPHAGVDSMFWNPYIFPNRR